MKKIFYQLIILVIICIGLSWYFSYKQDKALAEIKPEIKISQKILVPKDLQAEANYWKSRAKASDLILMLYREADPETYRIVMLSLQHNKKLDPFAKKHIIGIIRGSQKRSHP